MWIQHINRLSGRALIVLAAGALALVLWGYTLPPQADEGTPAHVFQLTVVTWLALFLVSIATTDWSNPMRSARLPAVATALMALAFVALYFLEH